MNRQPLDKYKMKEAITRGGYLPQTIGFWVYPDGFGERSADVEKLLKDSPNDVLTLVPTMPGYGVSPFKEHPYYVWGGCHESASAAIDSQSYISDWSQLDSFIKNMPKADFGPMLDDADERIRNDGTGRYRLGHFWFFFYERLWSFRGMENALADLCLNPDEVKRLLQALCDFYIGVIKRMDDRFGLDGFYVTDDLGSQANLMFSPDTFLEIFLPYYKQVVDVCHGRGLHFWLHSCGNIESILPDLIRIGVDIVHPIQKYTMDEAFIAEKYRGQICFMCGMDVQQTMPFGTPEDVRAEVRRLVDVFGRDGGRMIFSLGNGTTPNIPAVNLFALYDEVYKHR